MGVLSFILASCKKFLCDATRTYLNNVTKSFGALKAISRLVHQSMAHTVSDPWAFVIVGKQGREDTIH